MSLKNTYGNRPLPDPNLPSTNTPDPDEAQRLVEDQALESCLKDPNRPLSVAIVRSVSLDGIGASPHQRMAFSVVRNAPATAESWAGPDAQSLTPALDAFEGVIWPEVEQGEELSPMEWAAFGEFQGKIAGWALKWEMLKQAATSRYPKMPESCWPGAWWWPVPFGRTEKLALVLLDPAIVPSLGTEILLYNPHTKKPWRGVAAAAQWAPWEATRRECETMFWGAFMEKSFFLGAPAKKAGAGKDKQPAGLPKFNV